MASRFIKPKVVREQSFHEIDVSNTEIYLPDEELFYWAPGKEAFIK